MTDDSVQAQFEVIFDTYGKEILRYIGFKIADKFAAEDIASGTFLKYWERHSSGDNIDNPRALLYLIARGLVIDHYRRESRRQTVPIEFIEDMFEDESATNAIDARKNHARILTHVRELKAEYQEVVLLHYVEGLTIPEVAAILEESENNVRVRLHRAVTKLREMTL